MHSYRSWARALIVGATLLTVGPLASATAAPTIQEFPVAPKDQLPLGIAGGSDGNLWFTMGAKSAIGRSDTAGSMLPFFKTGISGAAASIAAGPEGDLWFTEPSAQIVGRITPLGTVTEYETNDEPWDIVAGPDGAMWFTAPGNPGAIGRVDPRNGKVTQFTAGLSTDRKPLGIAAGPDGALWFTEAANPGAIGRITTAGAITEYSVGLIANSHPTGIAAGPDGALWFTQEGNPGAIGRVSTNGTITEYTNGLTANSAPFGIAAADDGNLHFTEAGGGRVGTITPAGTITELATPSNNSQPARITAGPDGNLWFTEDGAHGQIATITVAPGVQGTSVSGVHERSAALNATVAANSQATSYHFEYGPTTAYGTQTAPAPAGAAASPTPQTSPISGLAPGSVYHFRAIATNASGTTVGPDASFSTLDPPAVPTQPAGSTGAIAGPLTAPLLGGPAPTTALPPVIGSSAALATVSGTITVRSPGSGVTRVLSAATDVPMGSLIDASHGTVRLTTATNAHGTTQSADIWGAAFVVRQTVSNHGMTTLTLAGRTACRARVRRGGRTASTSRVAAKPPHTLWGKDNHGHFSTRGQNSVATVRGTYWGTQDSCRGTLTIVRKGAVAVRDLHRHRTIIVRAGHTYLAR